MMAWEILGGRRIGRVVGWSLLLAGGGTLPVSAGETGPAPSGGRAALVASAEPGWPQFRGPRRDGTSDERGLLRSWPDGGPRELWSVSGLGRGYSSPVFGGGRWYITGDFGEELRILAFDRQGRPQWSVVNGSSWLNQYQGARASVTYSGGRVYHQNAHGRVVCLEAETGREVWAVSLLERFRGENIRWGLSDCLLVDERLVYTAPGGRDALLAAFDKRTGELRWKTDALFDTREGDAPESAGYASPVLIQFAGRRLLLGNTQRHLYCADAETGRLQWTRRRETPYSVIAMMPVLVGDAVFNTAPLGPPGQLHALRAPGQPGGLVGVEDLWTTALDTCQGGVVQAQGRLFGSHYRRGRGWAALDARSGETLWEAPELAKGAVLLADERLYLLCEDGWVVLADPAAARLEVKGRFRFVTAKDRDAWAHPVVLDGQLYLRHHDLLRCYDVREGP